MKIEKILASPCLGDAKLISRYISISYASAVILAVKVRKQFRNTSFQKYTSVLLEFQNLVIENTSQVKGLSVGNTAPDFTQRMSPLEIINVLKEMKSKA